MIYHTPDWQDFVELSFAEIRLYGAGNFQIARRLRAVIMNLLNTLPEHRSTALRNELELLDCTTKQLYKLPHDLTLASEPDPQGLGGSSRSAA